MVAIVSLSNGILIDFHKKRQHTESGQQERVMSVYLQPRSLFVFAEELYTHHLHVIEPRKTDAIDNLVRLARMCTVMPLMLLVRKYGSRWSEDRQRVAAQHTPVAHDPCRTEGNPEKGRINRGLTQIYIHRLHTLINTIRNTHALTHVT